MTTPQVAARTSPIGGVRAAVAEIRRLARTVRADAEAGALAGISPDELTWFREAIDWADVDLGMAGQALAEAADLTPDGFLGWAYAYTRSLAAIPVDVLDAAAGADFAAAQGEPPLDDL